MFPRTRFSGRCGQKCRFWGLFVRLGAIGRSLEPGVGRRLPGCQNAPMTHKNRRNREFVRFSLVFGHISPFSCVNFHKNPLGRHAESSISRRNGAQVEYRLSLESLGHDDSKNLYYNAAGPSQPHSPFTRSQAIRGGPRAG